MGDSNSSLPVRSESDGVDAKVVVKIIDGQTGGTNQMQVDSDKNAHVELHGNSATANTDTVVLLSEEGRVNARGDYNASTNTKPASSATIVHGRTATPAEANQTIRPTGVASTDGSNAFVQDVGVRDEAGNAFTTTNPLPVTLVDSEGSEVNDYATATVVGAATSNHDYTVTTAKTLKLTQVWASCSGKLKVEVMIETGVASGTFTTKFVGFNSTSDPNVPIPIAENIAVAAGIRVRVALTNRDLTTDDVYSTISGHEIP